jgi:hypothetical protein
MSDEAFLPNQAVTSDLSRAEAVAKWRHTRSELDAALPSDDATATPHRDRTPFPVVRLGVRFWISLIAVVIVGNLIALWIGEQYLAHQIGSAFSNVGSDTNIFRNITSNP